MPLASISNVTSICGIPRGAGRYSDQIELAQELVVGRHFPLALKYTDGYRGLVVLSGGKDLALAGRNRGVLLNQLGENAAERFDTKRERCHVEQENVLDVALEHPGLNRRADCHHLVGIYAFVTFPAKQFLNPFLHRRHPGHPAHQHDFVDVAGAQTGILKRGETGAVEPLQQIGAQAPRVWPGSVSCSDVSDPTDRL